MSIEKNTKRRRLLPNWLRRLLEVSATHRYYPLVVALIAFVVTATFSFPFAAVLIPAVLLAPGRWISIGLLCGLASGFGAAVLVEVFHHLGWEFIAARYPELVQLDALQWVRDWLQNYGLIALLIIAASPMPQTPALLVYSLVDPSIPGVAAAIGIGKSIKYLFLSWVTARYPGRFVRYT
jgi:membrane protein YqaA with SNARE-associated domain